MWEPPSDHLQRQLADLDICSPRDLRRCRPLIRRLARDLPTFDSVRLDALVQLGRLTPFQARRLEAQHPQALRVGPCLFIDRLGGGPVGETYLARADSRRQLCVLKLVRRELSTVETEERLADLISRVNDYAHPSLVFPQAVNRVEDRLVLLSRHVDGPHLAELLVRRGRFPPAIVWEIGRQLAEALALLEERAERHGDIRLANVRLTRKGTAVLVDGGIRPILDPAVTIHSRLPSDRFDGLAPELIGSTRLPDMASDRYALGCLLWQLLAGRPPFPGGDPLVKLAAHQKRRVDDVRKWVPDLSASLAEGVWRLTSPNAAERPSSYRELLAVWKPPTRGGRRRLSAFRRWFDTPAPPPRDKPAGAGRRVARALALVTALCLAALALSQQGARNVILSWGTHVVERTLVSDSPLNGAPASLRREGPLSVDAASSPIVAPVGTLDILPDPDPTGTIRLSTSGPFLARDIRAVGALHIVGPEDRLAEIVVADRPWSVSAESLHAERLHVRRDASPATSLQAGKSLLLVQAQRATFERCRIETGSIGGTTFAADASAPTSLQSAGVAWRRVDAADPWGGVLAFRNCVLLGEGASVLATDPPQQLEFSNCLRLGAGPLVHLSAAPAAKKTIAIELSHVTCRATGAVLRFAPLEDAEPRGEIFIDAQNCVFDLSPGDVGLIELTCRDEHVESWLQRLRVTGDGTVAPEGMIAASHRETSTIDSEDNIHRRAGDSNRARAIDASELSIEGLSTGSYTFAGRLTPHPADSEIIECNAPRRTPQPPGIVAKGLPVDADPVAALPGNALRSRPQPLGHRLQ